VAPYKAEGKEKEVTPFVPQAIHVFDDLQDFGDVSG
jgi:hypothetical protein